MPAPALSRRRALLLGMAVALGSCATAPGAPAGPATGEELAGEGPAPMTVVGPPPPPPVVPETCDAMVGGDSVRRAAVVQAVDAGLGVWLRGVRVDPQLVQGRFRGWIVRTLYPGDACYGRIDIREGDVVTRVNGRSVERDWQAHDVFVALRTAPEITVDYLRAGVARKLRVAIVDR